MSSAPPVGGQKPASRFEEDVWFAFWISVCIFFVLFPSVFPYLIDGFGIAGS